MTVTKTPGSLMRAEIAEQPDRWLDLIRTQKDAIDEAAALITVERPEMLVMIARGSSDHAARYAQYLAQQMLEIPVQLSTPATVTVHGAALRYPAAVALAISQSGESPDLIETARSCQRAGVSLITFTNNPQSALARLGDVQVDLSAGVERSVAATKTYTAELLALLLTLARVVGRSWESLTAEVDKAVAVARGLVRGECDGGLVEGLATTRRALIVGRGYSMSSAQESALKLMETSAIAASGWSASDATHGPLGQIEPRVPVIALTSVPEGRESVQAFALAAHQLGGAVHTFGPAVEGLSAVEPVLTESHDVWSPLIPLLEIIPIQRLALSLSLWLGRDPDSPAGLNKLTKTT